jgi:two-component system, NtrC family, response regulator AtoC
LAAGAIDYLPWPTNVETTRKLFYHLSMRSRASTVASSLPPMASGTGLLGSSPQLTAARDLLTRAAGGVTTVLVRGETGTGKDLAAHAIHTQSQRASGPFIKVHAPAVPDALLESELFGYERGAFTGAASRKPGRVELAEGGTLFLDEIGDISQVMQAKLLRLLQDREFERLGGTRTLRADIRVVAATHRDLEYLVASGSFREDLFYRLKVLTIWLPPLRARREDIAVIAQHYLDHFSNANGKRVRLAPAAMSVLRAERWPGNVRQLVNFLERLVVLATMTEGEPAHPSAPADAALQDPAPLIAPSRSQAPSTPTGLHFSSAVRPLKDDLRAAELRAITKALHVAKGNRALAARLLGVSRRTLYTKLAEHGLE